MPSRRAPRGTTQRLAVLLAGVLAVGVGTATYLTDALSRAEQGTVNARFALRDAPPPKGIVVVAIDDVTFSDLGLPWPFPRSRHAAAIDRLHAAGAREIVYDIQFTEPTARREDLALYRAIERAGGAVLATTVDRRNIFVNQRVVGCYKVVRCGQKGARRTEELTGVAAAARDLARPLGMSVPALTDRLTGHRAFAYVRKDVQPDIWREVARLGVPGLDSEQASRRVYPGGQVGAAVIGFVSKDGKAWGRPVGVAIDGQGALLVADDVGNVIWRVAKTGSGPVS